MKTIYLAGSYKLVLEDNEGKTFTFLDIKLSSKQAREVFKSKMFAGVQIRELSYNGDTWTTAS